MSQTWICDRCGTVTNEGMCPECGEPAPLKMFGETTLVTGTRRPVVYSDKPVSGGGIYVVPTIFIISAYIAFAVHSTLVIEVVLGVLAAYQTGRVLIQKYQLEMGRRRALRRK